MVPQKVVMPAKGGIQSLVKSLKFLDSRLRGNDENRAFLTFCGFIKLDDLATTRKQHYFVIPVKTGIQYFQLVTKALDTRLRGYDELLHVHQTWESHDPFGSAQQRCLYRSLSGVEAVP